MADSRKRFLYEIEAAKSATDSSPSVGHLLGHLSWHVISLIVLLRRFDTSHTIFTVFLMIFWLCKYSAASLTMLNSPMHLLGNTDFCNGNCCESKSSSRTQKSKL
ncbi:hypothetical protein RND81_01G087500 [Saponaria officinalis]|uniref:Uncharacterized protein n=1 Tax=Saponaria officinalis TaxID=3572 RepID=A0AAW1NCM2_SAPOF